MAKTALLDWRTVVAWFGDRLPGRPGIWLLTIADDSEEPWLDDEGRVVRRSHQTVIGDTMRVKIDVPTWGGREGEVVLTDSVPWAAFPAEKNCQRLTKYLLRLAAKRIMRRGR